MKVESEKELSLKVERITVASGLGLLVLSLGGLALTRGEFRPAGFLVMAGLGLVVAVVGVLELRKAKRAP